MIKLWLPCPLHSPLPSRDGVTVAQRLPNPLVRVQILVSMLIQFYSVEPYNFIAYTSVRLGESEALASEATTSQCRVIVKIKLARENGGTKKQNSLTNQLLT